LIQGSDRASIPLQISIKFGSPEGRIARGSAAALALVPVPEAAVDKNGSAKRGQCYVRPAGEILTMKAIAKACCVQFATYVKLRFGVASLDSGHHSGADCWRDPIQLSLRPTQSL
jgi:hypothetical protein